MDFINEGGGEGGGYGIAKVLNNWRDLCQATSKLETIF